MEVDSVDIKSQLREPAIFLLHLKMTTNSLSVSDDLIAIQRLLLAQRVLQAKGLVEYPWHHSKSPPPQVPDSRFLLLKGEPEHHLCPNNRLLLLGKVSQREDHQMSLAPKYPPSPAFKTDYRYSGDVESVSTATMTIMSHEPPPPLHLPTFKPAAGCISASDFMIRVFVARLRSGITVIKHGRSKFKKSSRPCVLKLDCDGESLLWMAARPDKEASETNQTPQNSAPCPRRVSSKRLKLSQCQEVRLALSIDPERPTLNGSAILREKCDAADANKSFALVFEHRTLDITSMTQDQAKMLTEGFSALCYRLHLQKNTQQAQTRCYPYESKSKSCLLC